MLLKKTKRFVSEAWPILIIAPLILAAAPRVEGLRPLLHSRTDSRDSWDRRGNIPRVLTCQASPKSSKRCSTSWHPGTTIC